MNIKIDRKIDVAGRKKRKKTFLLIFLASFIALVLSFFVISLPDIPASSKQTSKTNETTTYSPRLQAESPNKYENLEALSYFETKKKLQVIAGVEENRNIYSNRARELLERLESLGEGFWEDQKRGEFLIDQSRVFIEQIERKKNGYVESLKAAYIMRDVAAFQSNLESLKKISDYQAVEQKWQSTLTNLKKIDNYVLEINTARSNNDIETEFEALNALGKLASLTVDEEGRLKVLTKKYDIKRYNSHIKEAKQYLATKQYQRAKKELAFAQSLYPSKNEIVVLQEEIELSSKKAQFDYYVYRAKQFIAEDNWTKAEKNLENALLLFPTDDEVAEKLKFARKISYLKIQLEKFSENPLRLSDHGVRKFAINLIKENAFVFSMSQNLSKKKNEIEKLIEDLTIAHQITLLSDGKTEIEIKGVGYVLPTTSKIISLNPGTYRVIGKCKGHKDRLLDIDIPSVEKETIIRVYCGEQI